MDWNTPTPYVAIGAAAAVLTLFFAVGRHLWERAEKKAEWRGRTDESVGNLKTTLANIEYYLRRIFERGLPEKVADSNSPVSEHVGAADWAREEAAKLHSQLEGKEAFEVHEFAQEHVQDDSHLGEDIDRRMRKTAYEKNVEIAQVRTVLAVELRDALLRNLPDA